MEYDKTIGNDIKEELLRYLAETSMFAAGMLNVIMENCRLSREVAIHKVEFAVAVGLMTEEQREEYINKNSEWIDKMLDFYNGYKSR